MKHEIRSKKKGAIEGLVLFLVVIIFFVFGIGVISCVGQSFESDPNFPGSTVKTAGKAINVAVGVNMQAKAVPMRASINSPYAELKPAFAPSGEELYFSRVSHPDNAGGEYDQEDIWYSKYDSTTSIWSEPIRMPGYLNNDGPNFIENVSKTGDTIILGNQYMKKGKMRDGVSYSVNVNGEWSFPKPITIMDAYNVSNHGNHFVSLKLGVIISAVERSETNGHRDLYISFWNGEYATQPVNMGGIINSSMEESSPYLACDNQTLYFASKGHNGYGGYDVFMTTRLDDSWTNWTVPVNLGPAVNGHMDEEFFSITHCGRYAIFTKQMSVHNEDLYKIPVEELFGKSKAVVPTLMAGSKSEKEVKIKEMEVKKETTKKPRHTMSSL
jgi:OmpA-OmpF porin, OOP family